MALPSSATDWTEAHVKEWLTHIGFGSYGTLLCDVHKINGTALLMLSEKDLKSPPLSIEVLGDVKNLAVQLFLLRMRHEEKINKMGFPVSSKALLALPFPSKDAYGIPKKKLAAIINAKKEMDFSGAFIHQNGSNRHTRESSPEFVVDELNFFVSPADGNPTSPGMATHLDPEIGKTFLSITYFVVVTIITSLVMVTVHDRVPDMKKYPPLPDIFLDNVPLIPWAFDMCEVSGCLLLITWILVLVCHKHRIILMRRFFALTGTVFLLRCVTMMITSLSVPGSHLDCSPRPYGDIWAKLEKALEIWRGFGMSVQGVRTCGDYMFSGHTVTLTMLNFFITEYTPRRLYFLHTFTWILNLFGVFFILAAREHYSIDVFVAFYISSRMFLYYHTLANSRTLKQRDRYRARVWFPLFSFFEARIDGMVPNEYQMPWTYLSLASLNSYRRRWKKFLLKLWKHVGFSQARKLNSNVSDKEKPDVNHKRSKKKN
ncbi:sphingomyelin synthase-related protein 1 [Daphnia magna]|uniref:sphingomyelin synthase-related protein 1 n=1 Tax=Daphnia magna TaxID=35525 RepID=UPI001E1BC394|nr:sphingomyelin synthase-related protein 1 [Daphnia magna]